MPGESADLSALLHDRVAEILRNTRLTVVVLGPGQGTALSNPDYEKRLRVHHFLRDRFPTDSVVLPEEIVDEQLIEQAGVGLSEAELVRLCDLVIALMPPGAKASGVLAEIIEFVRIEGFLEKLWVFRPDDRIGAELGYAERRVYELVHPTRFVDYSAEWWQMCQNIRELASSMIDKARRQILAITLGSEISK